jgi:hypothetical protein
MTIEDTTISDSAIYQTLGKYLTEDTMARLTFVIRRPCLARSGEILDLVSDVLTEGMEIGYVDGYLDGHRRIRLLTARGGRWLRRKLSPWVRFGRL